MEGETPPQRHIEISKNSIRYSILVCAIAGASFTHPYAEAGAAERARHPHGPLEDRKHVRYQHCLRSNQAGHRGQKDTGVVPGHDTRGHVK